MLKLSTARLRENFCSEQICHSRRIFCPVGKIKFSGHIFYCECTVYITYNIVPYSTSRLVMSRIKVYHRKKYFDHVDGNESAHRSDL
jgi:hypothetical protein